MNTLFSIMNNLKNFSDIDPAETAEKGFSFVASFGIISLIVSILGLILFFVAIFFIIRAIINKNKTNPKNIKQSVNESSSGFKTCEYCGCATEASKPNCSSCGASLNNQNN